MTPEADTPAVVVAGDALIDLTPTTTVRGELAYEPHPGGRSLQSPQQTGDPIDEAGIRGPARLVCVAVSQELVQRQLVVLGAGADLGDGGIGLLGGEEFPPGEEVLRPPELD